MKRRKVDSNTEVKILTGLITSDLFAQGAVSIVAPDFFQADFVQLVSEWCVEYINAYGKAPQQEIESIYESKSATLEEEENEAIEDFLEDLSDAYDVADKFNVEYWLDKTTLYFKERALAALAEGITGDLAMGKVERADGRLGDFKRVERVIVSGVNPLRDEDVIRRAFAKAEEPLFKFPGALGAFLNDQLIRTGFIAIQAPEKRGKSFWLAECAYRAYRQRCNVALFQLGDMDEADMTLRLQIRLAGRSNLKKYCGDIHIPERNPLWDPDDEESDEVIYRTEYVDPKDRLTATKAIWHTRKFDRLQKGCDLRMATFPNSTASVAGQLLPTLDRWEEYDGFVPDVIVMDYMDIMDAEPGDERLDLRHQINGNWSASRGMAQLKHALVIAATQADIDANTDHTQSRKNFTEDKRKGSHVTSMWGLNQTDAEKAAGVMRINNILLRSGDYNTSACVKVLQCLQKGRPYIDSYF